ncbi:MAG: response regulator transcription factor [Thermomicrobiales bacterium]|nr:response regulator transcription factor [Thermomicrobiales bacterium]
MSEGTPARLRVAVVAAAPALRAGLSALLAADPGLQPVALDDFALASDVPDAVVIDYSLGEPDRAPGLAEALPATPLILIGADPATDGPGLADTPVAYLPMDIEAAPLAAAVRAVAAGLIVLDPVIAGSTRAQTDAPVSADSELLTARELEVLQGITEGLSNLEIGQRLYCSEPTVKSHVRSMLAKLALSNRVQLVIFAYESRFVSP